MSTVTPSFEKALAIACLRAATKRAASDPFRGGDLTAVQYGALIGDIADEADLSIPQTRRRLQAMQRDGLVLRDDRRGGSTAWWPVGLAAQQRPTAVPVPVPVARDRQSLTVPPANNARQHWSEVLGVERDCSTSTARAAFGAALGALDESDPDYLNQRQRVHAAIDACCREHDIQIQE